MTDWAEDMDRAGIGSEVDGNRYQLVTPPPAATALAAALRRVVPVTVLDNGDLDIATPALLAALAASGWQVTRRARSWAALDDVPGQLLDLFLPLLDAPYSYRARQDRLDERMRKANEVYAILGRDPITGAALASGEEGQ